jgi:hypothetical protein
LSIFVSLPDDRAKVIQGWDELASLRDQSSNRGIHC